MIFSKGLLDMEGDDFHFRSEVRSGSHYWRHNFELSHLLSDAFEYCERQMKIIFS